MADLIASAEDLRKFKRYRFLLKTRPESDQVFARHVPAVVGGGVTVCTVLTLQSSHVSYNAIDHLATAVLLRRKGDSHLH